MNRPRSCQIITLWGTGNDDSQKDLCEVLAKYNNVSNCMKNWNALVPSFWMHIMVCQAAVLNRPSATTFHSVCVHCLNSIKKRKRPNFEQCMLCLWNACPTYLPPTCALLLHLSVCLSVCLPSSLSPPLMNACVCVCVWLCTISTCIHIVSDSNHGIRGCCNCVRTVVFHKVARGFCAQVRKIAFHKVAELELILDNLVWMEMGVARICMICCGNWWIPSWISCSWQSCFWHGND